MLPSKFECTYECHFTRDCTKVRRFAFDQVRQLFQKVNIIVTPTTPLTAPAWKPDALPYGDNDIELLTELAKFIHSRFLAGMTICRFTFLANLVGIPGMNVPAGYDSQGLPIGFQMLAGHWNEHILLRAASALEDNIHLRKPKAIYFSPLA